LCKKLSLYFLNIIPKLKYKLLQKSYKFTQSYSVECLVGNQLRSSEINNLLSLSPSVSLKTYQFCNHTGGPRDPLKKRYSLSDSIMHLIEDHGEMVKYLRNKSERYKPAVYIIYYMLYSIVYHVSNSIIRRGEKKKTLLQANLGRVVRKPVKANPGLKVNRSIVFSCIKMFFTAHVLCSLNLVKFKTEGQTL